MVSYWSYFSLDYYLNSKWFPTGPMVPSWCPNIASAAWKKRRMGWFCRTTKNLSRLNGMKMLRPRWRKHKTLQACSNPSHPLAFLSYPWNPSTPVLWLFINTSGFCNLQKFLPLNVEGISEVEFHLDLKDVVHVASSIDQRLQNLLLCTGEK